MSDVDTPNLTNLDDTDCNAVLSEMPSEDVELSEGFDESDIVEMEDGIEHMMSELKGVQDNLGSLTNPFILLPDIIGYLPGLTDRNLAGHMGISRSRLKKLIGGDVEPTNDECIAATKFVDSCNNKYLRTKNKTAR